MLGDTHYVSADNILKLFLILFAETHFEGKKGGGFVKTDFVL